jgi:hypothetical protein
MFPGPPDREWVFHILISAPRTKSTQLHSCSVCHKTIPIPALYCQSEILTTIELNEYRIVFIYACFLLLYFFWLILFVKTLYEWQRCVQNHANNNPYSWKCVDGCLYLNHYFNHSYTPSIPNIRNTIILSCNPSPFDLRTDLIRRGMDSRCWKHPQGCQRFAQLCQVSWMSFGWTLLVTQETVVWKTQKHCSSWHKLVCLAPMTIPHSKALKYFVLPIRPLNGTHT